MSRWHALEPGAAADRLGVDPLIGLSGVVAGERLRSCGPNALAEPPRRSRILLFLEQFRSLLAYVLAGTAVLAAVVGDAKDSIVIVVVLVVNAGIGFVQVNRAERSMDALKRMLVVRARVRRDSHVVEVFAEVLVPGDVVLLEAGDRVPADGRLLTAAGFALDESALTGESAPVDKVSVALDDDDLPVAERANVAFMNTTVARGSAELLVTHTGMRTQIGQIAGILAGTARAETPLQRQLDSLGRRIALLAGVASVVVLVLALLEGDPFSEATLTAVALAVASIPEGLPAVVAVTLAVGARQMARHNAIVKRLASVETLGSTSVICSDKTGTLTLNQMTARALVRGIPFDVEGHGYERAGSITPRAGVETPDLRPALIPAVLCNNSALSDDGIVGDPTEVSLVVLAGKAGIDADAERQRWPRIAEVPFDAAHKFMATFHRDAAANPEVLECVKGAPEALLERCAWVSDEIGMVHRLDDDRRRTLQDDVDALAERGLRVLAIASRVLGGAERLERSTQHELFQLVDELRLEALVGIQDPARPEARDAVASCRTAGIQVKMITGDHPVTAQAIAADLGITGRAVTGDGLNRLSADQLGAEIDEIGVFARVAPEHKVRIVKALQLRGHIVAMTGDGVNDAAALKTADIGVAMGITGTEVTKEAGEMILADDNFATIVTAVKSGRTIYDNILKFVRFQLSTNVGAILTIIGARLVGLPTPFTPIQMLWVNLIMDGPPAIALGVDPPAPDVLLHPPRPASDRILTPRRLVRLSTIGLVMATGTLIVFARARQHDLVAAGTMAFTTFVILQLFNAINARSVHASAFGRHTFTNWRLWAALGTVAMMQVAAVQIPALQEIFDTTALSPAQWSECLLVATSVLLVDESRKMLTRTRARSAHSGAGPGETSTTT